MQVLVPLYFHCKHMPDQAELQQAILGIVCQPDGPSDMIFEGLREVFPNAGWTDGELGTCDADRSSAQHLADLLGHAYGQDRFSCFLVAHLGFKGEDVALEHILRRSGARLDPYAYDINAVPREDPRVLGTCIICHEVVLMCPSGPCCPKGHLGAQYTEKT